MQPEMGRTTKGQLLLSFFLQLLKPTLSTQIEKELDAHHKRSELPETQGPPGPPESTAGVATSAGVAGPSGVTGPAVAADLAVDNDNMPLALSQDAITRICLEFDVDRFNDLDDEQSKSSTDLFWSVRFSPFTFVLQR